MRFFRSVKPLVLILLFVPFLISFEPQGKAPSPKKVEKMREKNAKQAQAKYEKDVKRHMNNQSKETKAMMKKAKKDARKHSPVKPASGKKCK